MREFLSAIVILLSVVCSCSKSEHTPNISNKTSNFHFFINKDCTNKSCFINIDGETLSIQTDRYKYSYTVHSSDYTHEGKVYTLWGTRSEWIVVSYLEHNHLLDIYFYPNDTGKERKAIIFARRNGREKRIHIIQSAY